MKEQFIEKWSTLKEVQEYLGVGRDTILQWIAKRIRSGGAADDNSGTEN